MPRIPMTPPGGTLRPPAGQLSDEVELYHRTYSTLLRSSGETLLRVLEPSHRAMDSSLHAGAGADEADLGAFVYAIHRLPAGVWRARRVVMGQDAAAFTRHGYGPVDDWEAIEGPARRRRWHDAGEGTLAVLIASSSDLDDLIPTLVAYQIEWNKLHRLAGAANPPEDVDAGWGPDAPGGSPPGRGGGGEAWPDGLAGFLDEVRGRELELRVRMLGGSEVGYARVTRRWWEPVLSRLREGGLTERPLYFVSSNTHSLVNLVTGTARLRESEIVDWLERAGP